MEEDKEDRGKGKEDSGKDNGNSKDHSSTFIHTRTLLYSHFSFLTFSSPNFNDTCIHCPYSVHWSSPDLISSSIYKNYSMDCILLDRHFSERTIVHL